MSKHGHNIYETIRPDEVQAVFTVKAQGIFNAPVAIKHGHKPPKKPKK